jgi:hypothetical protein
VVHLQCCNKVPETRSLIKTRNLFSHNFAGWEVQDQGASKLGCTMKLVCCFPDGTLLLCPLKERNAVFSHGRKWEGEPGVVAHTCNPSTQEAEAGGTKS